MVVRSGDRAKAFTALFDLVEEGVITGFKTNFFGQARPGWTPQVTVTVTGRHDKASLHRIGLRVIRAVDPLLTGISVTIGPATHSKTRG